MELAYYCCEPSSRKYNHMINGARETTKKQTKGLQVIDASIYNIRTFYDHP